MDTTTDWSAVSNRILIVDNQGMMGAGLESLLSTEKSLEVLGITINNGADLVHEIWRMRPGTIILIAESQPVTPIRLLELLADYGRLRIISVSMNNNNVTIYEKQQVEIGNTLSFTNLLQI